MSPEHHNERLAYRGWIVRASDDPDDAPPLPWAKPVAKPKRVPYRSKMLRKRKAAR